MHVKRRRRERRIEKEVRVVVTIHRTVKLGKINYSVLNPMTVFILTLILQHCTPSELILHALHSHLVKQAYYTTIYTVWYLTAQFKST